MNKTVALAFIIVSLTSLCIINAQPSRAAKTIVVPDDYPTISAAVNNASQGDTILVKRGVYYENLVIDKALSIASEDNKSTIVIGEGDVERGGHAVFTLAAEGIQLSGFTIESLNYSSSSYYATGIIIEADKCTITGNNIHNTYYGVFCSVQSSIIISQNNITANLKDGIRFYGGSSNKISENNITGNSKSGIAIQGYSNTLSRNNIKNNMRGIGIGSSYSVVFGNSITGNTEAGIYFAGSNNIVSANDITENKWGIYFTPNFAAPNDNKIYHNNFIDNDHNVYVSSYNVENWDNDFPSGGNYWSDYVATYPNAVEVDASGTGNVPYVIGANNTDRYPLITPFDMSNAGNEPSAETPPTTTPNSFVAYWSFDEVDANGVIPDAAGNTPAILGSEVGNVSYTPKQVEGKVGKALSFDGSVYANVPVLPSLETPEEITIDAWINVQSFKNVAYSNIMVECVRTTATYPTRTVGLAFNGEASSNISSVPQGALRGYVLTEDGVLNEVFTTESVISLNQWTHVVFTRSLATGMHIYVDGEEKNVTVISGAFNPIGSIERETELYIGHDAVCFIDELRISNTAINPLTQTLWMQWWFWTIIVAAVGGGLLIYFRKRSEKSLKLPSLLD